MNPQSLTDLIALGEGFAAEFKQAMPSDLGREMCAFANATGGVILLGVSDAGEIVGVADHNQLKSRVQSTARSAAPPISVEVESVGEVLCVKVPHKYPTSTPQVPCKSEDSCEYWMVSDLVRKSSPVWSSRIG